jgi:hypothetical protein
MHKLTTILSSILTALALLSSAVGRVAAQTAAPPALNTAVITVNLGDYAKGDGTDETDAIQRAFDALNPKRPDEKGFEFRNQRGVLFIPAPKKFYGISRTINVVEKWNAVIRCETPVLGAMKIPAYFQSLGPDEGDMFYFNFCGSLRIENLSLSGNRKKVTGIQICDFNRSAKPYKKAGHAGLTRHLNFDTLSIIDVGVGVRLGMGQPYGADVEGSQFSNVFVLGFSEYAFVSDTGNGANNSLINFSCTPRKDVKAKEGIRVTGGQLCVFNSTIGGGPWEATGAAVAVYAGGVNIYGCWSEWCGPFLYGHPQKPIAGTRKHDSHGRFSTILAGVMHYPGGKTQFWRTPDGKGEKPESENPVPVSVDWDYPVPLTLINCSFWGGVRLGPKSESPIIDIGTTFGNRDSKRFYGEGVEKHGRLLRIGTVHPSNVRAVEPYIVDRRNTPGIEPPKTGVWKKGDCIRNTDPDPAVPAKAWAGWICISAGEPGKWAPFGRIEAP